MSKRAPIRDQAIKFVRALGRLVIPAVSMVALAFLWFIAGGVAVMHGEGNARGASGSAVGMVKDTARYINLNLVNLFAGDPIENLWTQASEAVPSGDVVVRHDAARSDDGLTLVVSAGTQNAQLINIRGEVVHSWELPFREAFENHPRRDSIGESDGFSWRRVHLFPNGDIIAVYESAYLTPYGFGLIKMDRNSRPIWTNSGNFHHDVDVGPDGRIYALGMELSTRTYGELERMSTPYISEYVAVISPDGIIEKRIEITEAFANSIYRPSLHRMEFSSIFGDYIHSNSIEYITNQQAQAVPFLTQGQLLISIREMDMIAILDVEQETFVWAMAGMWRRQHSAQLLANGNFLIFDNLGNIGPGGSTRILEFDAVTQQVEWSYAGTEEEPLASAVFGTQQRLPNGNTMIVDSHSARIIEVTPDGEIVWEYHSPRRMAKGGEMYFPQLVDAVRFRPETLTFLDRSSASSGESAGRVVAVP